MFYHHSIQHIILPTAGGDAQMPITVERERERERERESFLNLHKIFYFNPKLLNPFAHPHRKATLLHWYYLVVKDVPP